MQSDIGARCTVSSAARTAPRSTSRTLQGLLGGHGASYHAASFQFAASSRQKREAAKQQVIQ